MDRRKTKKQVLTLCSILTALLALAGCAGITPPIAAPDNANTPSTPGDQAAFAGQGTEQNSTARIQFAVENFIPAAVVDEPTVGATVPQRFDNLWDRIRAGFAMEKLDGAKVERQERWFVDNPEYMARMIERARLYLYYIVEEVDKRGMPLEIALLPAIESAFKPHAYSRARASGLWQFIPTTGKHYGLKINWWYDGRRDIDASTEAALDYLEKLYSDFDGDWHLALAAYNAGENRIFRAISYNQRQGRPAKYSDLTALRLETKYYVPKLVAMVNIVSDPARYGVQLEPIPNSPYFTKVETGSQIDLAVVAELADMHIDDIARMNPGFNRWATDPDGPHHLLVPIDKKEALMDGLDKLSDEDRVQWRQHTVRRGETLSEIGRRYGVSVSVLRSTNHLRSTLIRAGQSLLIPISTRRLTPPRPPKIVRSENPASSNSQPVLHRVRSGETLWSIARRYGVLIQKIAEWNLMNSNDVLQLGQILKIWTSGAPSALLKDSSPALGAAGG
jgi:membrane-bound lytic murein transglycosylase D